MTQQHTQGRLKAGPKTGVYLGDEKHLKAVVEHETGNVWVGFTCFEDDAKRLAAAWNAAHDAGLSTAALEAGAVKDCIEALEPFAVFNQGFDGKRYYKQDLPDDFTIYTFNDVGITLGHLRRAQAAIARAKGGQS